MGLLHKSFIAVSVAAFLISTAVASVLPRRVPEIRLPGVLPRELIIPVDGVTESQLVDTWGAARSHGRKHEGIDIMARLGTPVRATAEGTIAKFFKSKRGGITIYEFDEAGRAIFYYAHLSAYAAGLKEGDHVLQGQLIAYVGSTGNATTPHLHFEILRASAAHQWWRGKALNPYLPLKNAHLPPDLAAVTAAQ
ncbi:MAG: peptidoglycan DD-metalloendopeptidase family protein [Alphaproteobacteria bacterium]|nr:peptidoglycan DD-metalloendopeptidase family protein [Alphaproteobacteria bacterium]